jgi:hypothetical protein
VKHSELDRVINDLRPAKVDELADAAHRRRPDAALVRARAGAPTDPRPLRTRPVRRRALTAGAATTVIVAALAAALIAAGVVPGARPAARTGASGSRALLLASARTAARQPATHGTCWYSRTRMWQDLPASPKPGPGVPELAGRHARHTYAATTASSAESWDCTRPGGTLMRFRRHGPLDIRTTFPTAEDEAAWRAAGSPPLQVNGGTTISKPSTATYDQGAHLVDPVIGSHEIPWKAVPELPATRSGLDAYLRKLWKHDREGGANGYRAPADYGLYVFESTRDLLRAPTTPGTRAALYRILADCPAVHVTGRTTDREGRTGVAVTAQTPDGVVTRMVIDPATARLLDSEDLPGDRPGTPGAHAARDYVAIEGQGWVNTIGAIPAP